MAEYIININYVLATAFLVLGGCGSGEISPSKTGSLTSSHSSSIGIIGAIGDLSSAFDNSLQAVVPKATYALGSQELAVFEYVNNRRVACGFGLLKQDIRLDASALAHAKYVVSPNSAAISHVESKAISMELFTGANPIDRAFAQGYPANPATFDEDFGAGFFSESNFAELLASDLMNAPLHLLSMLRSNRDVGIGVFSANRGAGSLPFKTLVLNMSTTVGTQEPNGVQTFPCEASLVPGAFFGGELPDPFPGRNYATDPMGSPIAILSRTGSNLVLSRYSFRKTGSQQELVLNVLSSVNRSATIRKNEMVLVPDLPLAPNASYAVSLTGTLDGVAWTKAFTFNTY
jgi:uncharacterized protein YkwD